MEYAKKLGYSEGQVKSAMKKLGPDLVVEKNDLLHELIKASTDGGKVPSTDGKLQNEEGKPEFSNSLYESITLSQPSSVSQSTSESTSGSFLRHIVVDGSNVAIR